MGRCTPSLRPCHGPSSSHPRIGPGSRPGRRPSWTRLTASRPSVRCVRYIPLPDDQLPLKDPDFADDRIHRAQDVLHRGLQAPHDWFPRCITWPETPTPSAQVVLILHGDFAPESVLLAGVRVVYCLAPELRLIRRTSRGRRHPLPDDAVQRAAVRHGRRPTGRCRNYEGPRSPGRTRRARRAAPRSRPARRCHARSKCWPPTPTGRCGRSTRARVWGLAGAFAPYFAINTDAPLVTSHNEKEEATPTYKRKSGISPMLAFADHGPEGTGEPLTMDAAALPATPAATLPPTIPA